MFTNKFNNRYSIFINIELKKIRAGVGLQFTEPALPWNTFATISRFQYDTPPISFCLKMSASEVIWLP